MPKIKLLDDPAVVELLNKRVAQIEEKARKDAARHQRGMVRAVREVLVELDLDKKVRKMVSDAVVSAMAQEAAGAAGAAAA